VVEEGLELGQTDAGEGNRRQGGAEKTGLAGGAAPASSSSSSAAFQAGISGGTWRCWFRAAA